MNNNEILQAIILKCEAEIANPSAGKPASAGTLADEILVIIDKGGEETKVLARKGAGLARLKRDKPIVILDLETSSAEKATAAIIEIAMVKIHPDGTRETFQALINPGFDISDEIAELTHITNDDLQGALPFGHYAEQVVAFIGDGYLCGFNLRNFDAPVLYENLYRVGINWMFPQDRIVDAMEIFHLMEPRSLAGAVRHYLAGDHSNAHRALPDVEATIDVLDAQLSRYDEDLPDDIETLILATKRDNRLDMAGMIILHDGVPCFGFGKHGPQGGKAPTPCHLQRGYLKWMLEQGDFTNNTKMIVQTIYDDTRPTGFRN